MKQGWEPWEDQPAVKKKLADVDNFLHLTGIDIGMYIYIYVSRLDISNFFWVLGNSTISYFLKQICIHPIDFQPTAYIKTFCVHANQL